VLLLMPLLCTAVWAARTHGSGCETRNEKTAALLLLLLRRSQLGDALEAPKALL
jgi:hypothetical protein